MRDYEFIVTRSKESIHGVVDESSDTRNHHYHTVFDVFPSDNMTCKMKLKTHIYKLVRGLRGILYDETLYVTLRDRTGTIVGTTQVAMGRAFKLIGQVTYEKDIHLPCTFSKIHTVGIHFK